MTRNEPEPILLHCPLCGHELQSDISGDMCQFCGAELAIVLSAIDTDKYAESCRERGESVRWTAAADGHSWMVGYKSELDQQVYRQAS